MNQCVPDAAVRNYYDDCYVDYRLVWANRDNYAMHFGYYQDGIRRHAEALNNANAVLADLADIRPGDRVLDCGCGVGGTSSWLAANRDAEVVGITPVESQVLKAREIAERRGLTGVTFEIGDYTRTDFQEASFDAAIALESLCHAADKGNFYREMYRVLRPGGRLVVAEYTRQSRSLSQSRERRMSSWLKGWAIGDIATREEHCAWARDAGFVDVEHRDASHYTRRSLRRLYRLSLLGVPTDFLMHRVLRLRTPVQSGNVRAARDQWHSFREASWHYGLLTARKN